MPESRDIDLVLATRGSPLALWQAHFVAEQLNSGGFTTSQKVIKTTGDRIQNRFLHEIGGKGLFVKEIEETLRQGGAHLAVHSLKDMPAHLPQGMTIAAILERHSPLDALVLSPKASSRIPRCDRLGFDEIAALGDMIIGTGSLRRQSLLRSANAAIKVVPIRGNVDTRLRKLQQGDWDAIILAHASLERLGITDCDVRLFDPEWFVPSPAQGALGIEMPDSTPLVSQVRELLQCEATHTCVTIERHVLRKLGADCTMPLGCHVEASGEGNVLQGRAVVLSRDGSLKARSFHTGAVEDQDGISGFGDALVSGLYENGAQAVLDALAAED